MAELRESPPPDQPVEAENVYCRMPVMSPRVLCAVPTLKKVLADRAAYRPLIEDTCSTVTTAVAPSVAVSLITPVLAPAEMTTLPAVSAALAPAVT